MAKDPGKTAKDDREARLAEALRANLLRRKAYMRAFTSKDAAAKAAPVKEPNG